MREIDPLVGQYSHLKKFDRESEALYSLQKIASLVKPIMRARNWKVGTLAEFWPEDRTLLGINQNRGQKICLRLRHPGDKNQFLPIEQVIDTMLHELSHIVFGPHDQKFHALWDQLRNEYQGLLMKGYTGEGFMSEGHVVGGRRVPRDEARRIARTAAEKRATLYAGSSQKLGGRPVAKGTDIRKVIVDAIEQRNRITKGCGANDQRDDKEMNDLADQATRNGFRTKAEEDKANEEAIAQALWDLVQEDEKTAYGDAYIPPTPSNPTGNGGGGEASSRSSDRKENAYPPTPSKPPQAKKAKAPPIRQHPDRPVSRLVTENASKKSKSVPKKTPAALASSSRSTSSSTPTLAPAPIVIPDPLSPKLSPELFASGWTCPICTLHNPLNFLACDACTSERPPEITKKIVEADRKAIITSQPPGLKKDTWTCRRCTTVMEQKWWTCVTCGDMKASS